MIRLNKVTKDLNVGVKTIVEFLQKKGYTDVDDNPNAKITDEQYAALVKEFSNDKNLRLESEKFSQERQNRERKETVQIEGFNEPVVEKEKPKVEKPKDAVIKTVLPEDRIPQFKPIGKIDLDSLNRKPKKTEQPLEEEVKPEEEKIQPQPVAEETAPKKVEENPVEIPKEEQKQEPVIEKETPKPVEAAPVEAKKEPVAEEPVVVEKPVAVEKVVEVEKPVEELPSEMKPVAEKPVE